jgi:hypothetical protein
MGQTYSNLELSKWWLWLMEPKVILLKPIIMNHCQWNMVVQQYPIDNWHTWYNVFEYIGWDQCWANIIWLFKKL